MREREMQDRVLAFQSILRRLNDPDLRGELELCEDLADVFGAPPDIEAFRKALTEECVPVDSLLDFADAFLIEGGSHWDLMTEEVVDALAAMGEEVVDTLCEAVSSMEWGYPMAAAKALAKIGGVKAVEALAGAWLFGACGDCEDQCEIVARALVAIGDPGCVPTVIECMQDQCESDDIDDLPEDVLVSFGPEAVRPLIEALPKMSAACRRRAIWVLRKIGVPSVEALIMALGEDSHSMRISAVEALGSLGDSRAVEPLIDLLEKSGNEVEGEASPLNRAAIIAVSQLGDTRYMPDVLESLAHDLRGSWEEFPPPRNHIKDVKDALREIGSPAVDAAVSALTDDRTPMNRAAIEAVGTLRDSRAVIPLIRACQEKPSLTFWHPIRIREAFVAIGPEVVHPLVEALPEMSIDLLGVVADALHEIGRPATEALVSALVDERSLVQIVAAMALSRNVTELDEERLTVLRAWNDYTFSRKIDSDAICFFMENRALIHLHIKLLDAIACSKAGDLRCMSIIIEGLGFWHQRSWWHSSDRAEEALFEIGAPAVDALISALRDSEMPTRIAATRLLGRIGDCRAVEPLLEAYDLCCEFSWGPSRDHYEDLHCWAAWALSRIGDPRGIRVMIAFLGSEYEWVEALALDALVKFGHEAVEPLIEAIPRMDDDAKYSTAMALGQIGSPQAVDALVGILQGEWEERWECARNAAVSALGRIRDHRAVAPLIGALGHESYNTRYAAVQALGEIGGPEALVALAETASADESDYVKRAARTAIGKITEP